MLRELRIKNFTIINELTISFEPGLNALTGETGAGKSIIVDALGLLLGDKASQDMIKTGAKEAQIEAFFDPIDHPLLKELSIESEEGVALRRTLSSQGKGRTYINDTSVNLQTLSEIGSSLVAIHGQHQHQSLLDREAHVIFLDSFGGLLDEAASVQALYNEAASLRGKLDALKARIQERSQRMEFLKFQVNEIDSAGLKPDEKKSIEEERAILLNVGKLKEASETAYSLLYESDQSCLSLLDTVVSKISESAQVDHSLKEALGSLESALPLLEDAAIQLRKLKDKYDLDPARLTELDERLDLIKRLEKKYGEGVESITHYREKAARELETLEHSEEEQESLEHALHEKDEALVEKAEALSKKRHEAAKKMESLVLNELRSVGFQKAEFKTDLKKRETVSEHGIDDIEFLFSANPGEPPKPLIKVASGGELSRIMLALTCIEIQKGPKAAKARRGAEEARTLIFDEVDAGIGGVTAQHVGNRLKAISGGAQVFCITHLPQIAALADYHLRVEKQINKDSVAVNVTPLSKKDRHHEIARMLSGKVTDTSLKHAEELLSQSA